MPKLLTFLLSILAVVPSWADLSEAQKRCAAPAMDEPIVYSEDVSNPSKHQDSTWWFTLDEMQSKFDEIYGSGKRLRMRAYYDPQAKSFILPFKNLHGTINPARAAENFILSLTKHIESALQQGYADYIFFPDMGHNHLYFPEEHWKKNYPDESIVTEDLHLHYQKMMADPEMRMLYHTAEKLYGKSLSGNAEEQARLDFRFWHRNVVGDNKITDKLEILVDKSSKGNAVGSIEGHHDWSAGFNISASEKGCFPFQWKGKTYYFDISIYDLEPKDAGLQ